MAVGLRKRRRIQLIVIGFVLVFVTTALIGFAFRDGIEFFRSPTQVLNEEFGADETFRIGGLVAVDSVEKNGEQVRFIVTDGANSVSVEFTGILPDLFAEKQGMIATGTYDGTVFRANEILAKHDENYMPKEVADALKEQGLYKPNAGEVAY